MGNLGKSFRRGTLLAATVAATALRARSATTLSYAFTNLGPSDLGINLAMNNNVPPAVVGENNAQAVYSVTGTAPLNVLGGANAPANSTATAVNDGQVVVGSFTANSGNEVAFYSVTSSTATTLTPLPSHFTGTGGATSSSLANGINGNATTSQVVGQAFLASGQPHAFSWTSGASTLKSLDPVSASGAPNNTGLGGGAFGFSTANGINASGLIVGQATNSQGNSTGFLYVPSTSKMYDLGTLGAPGDGDDSSNALAINPSGEIVGYTDSQVGSVNQDPRAFVIKSGYTIPTASASPDQSLFGSGTGMIDIGALPGGTTSEAIAVNAGGLVVGYSTSDSNGDDHAFIYNSSSGSPVMVDLNSTGTVTGLPNGLTLDSATGVNSAGDITGYSDDGHGHTFAYLLTPTPVPEPASVSLVMVGAAVVLARRSCQKKNRY